MDTNNKPLGVTQAADFLGFTRAYLYNLVHYGKIPAYKPGGKKLFFKQADLENYVYGVKKGGRSERADAILNSRKGGA